MNPAQVFEIKRQAFHLILGTAMAIAVYYLKPAYGLEILIPLIIALFVMLIIPRVAADFHISKKLLYHFEREEDVKKFPFKGAIYFGLGVIPPIVFLDVNHACAAIVTLSAGDSASTIFGKFYGKHRIGKKSIEGFVAGLIAGFVAMLPFVNVETAIIFATAGAIFEIAPYINDNLSIPWGITILYKLMNP